MRGGARAGAGRPPTPLSTPDDLAAALGRWVGPDGIEPHGDGVALTGEATRRVLSKRNKRRKEVNDG